MLAFYNLANFMRTLDPGVAAVGEVVVTDNAVRRDPAAYRATAARTGADVTRDRDKIGGSGSVRRERCALKAAMRSYSAAYQRTRRPRPAKPLTNVQIARTVERRQAAACDSRPQQPAI